MTSRTASNSIGLPSATWLLRGVTAAAFVVLAFEPVVWLARSWFVPGYDSMGAVVFAAVSLLFVWSASSALTTTVNTSRNTSGRTAVVSLPLALLLVSFVVRLLSQWLAINVIGALMLALDVYALGLLFRLSERQRAVSPMMLAALFCFCLPLEMLLQRTLGFALQQLSAAGACTVLELVHHNAGCLGVRLFIDNMDVMVDLPCSGARLLVLMLAGYCAMTALQPLPIGRLLVGLGWCLILAAAANMLRILLLAWGLRYADRLSVNVMLDPWHSGIGLLTTGVALLLLQRYVFRSARLLRMRDNADGKTDTGKSAAPSAAPAATIRQHSVVSVTAVSVTAALLLLLITPAPMDVSRPVSNPDLPVTLAGLARTPLGISQSELDYFAQFGGGVSRAAYGPHSLLLVTTSSPLRHLHAPDVCFSSSGYRVDYLGARFTPVPQAVYRTRAPGGQDLRVSVQFVSASGRIAVSVGEVVWHWLRAPAEAWTMVQVVSPWQDDPGPRLAGTSDAATADEFRSAVNRVLNLNNPEERT